jgi:hypothetical protein
VRVTWLTGVHKVPKDVACCNHCTDEPKIDTDISWPRVLASSFRQWGRENVYFLLLVATCSKSSCRFGASWCGWFPSVLQLILLAGLSDALGGMPWLPRQDALEELGRASEAAWRARWLNHGLQWWAPKVWVMFHHILSCFSQLGKNALKSPHEQVRRSWEISVSVSYI